MKKLILTMIAVLLGVTFIYAEGCKDSPVQTEYKTEDSDCGFKKRTCCYDGNWSGWDEACPKPDCGEDKCWDGYKCIDAYIKKPRQLVSFYEGYVNGGGNSGVQYVGGPYGDIRFENKEACLAAVEAKKEELISKGFKYLGYNKDRYANTLNCNDEKRFKEKEFRFQEATIFDKGHILWPCTCTSGGCYYEFYIFTCHYQYYEKPSCQ